MASALIRPALACLALAGLLTVATTTPATAADAGLTAAASAVRSDWERVAEDSGPGGSARQACTMISSAVFSKYMKNLAGGSLNLLARTCTTAVADNQYRYTHLPQVNGCHRHAFTAHQVADYVAAAQRFLTITPVSDTEVRAALSPMDPVFADVSQTEVWKLERRTWVDTTARAPLFSPQC